MRFIDSPAIASCLLLASSACQHRQEQAAVVASDGATVTSEQVCVTKIRHDATQPNGGVSLADTVAAAGPQPVECMAKDQVLQSIGSTKIMVKAVVWSCSVLMSIDPESSTKVVASIFSLTGTFLTNVLFETIEFKIKRLPCEPNITPEMNTNARKALCEWGDIGIECIHPMVGTWLHDYPLETSQKRLSRDRFAKDGTILQRITVQGEAAQNQIVLESPGTYVTTSPDLFTQGHVTINFAPGNMKITHGSLNQVSTSPVAARQEQKDYDIDLSVYPHTLKYSNGTKVVKFVRGSFDGI